MAETKDEVATMLSSVLTSEKAGVALRRLEREYETLIGTRIPYRRLGYSTLEEFLRDLRSVVRLSRGPDGETVVHAVMTEATAHVAEMVKGQKSNKPKPMTRPSYRRPMHYGQHNYRPNSTLSKFSSLGGGKSFKSSSSSHPSPAATRHRPGFEIYHPPSRRFGTAGIHERPANKYQGQADGFKKVSDYFKMFPSVCFLASVLYARSFRCGTRHDGSLENAMRGAALQSLFFGENYGVFQSGNPDLSQNFNYLEKSKVWETLKTLGKMTSESYAVACNGVIGCTGTTTMGNTARGVTCRVKPPLDQTETSALWVWSDPDISKNASCVMPVPNNSNSTYCETCSRKLPLSNMRASNSVFEKNHLKADQQAERRNPILANLCFPLPRNMKEGNSVHVWVLQLPVFANVLKNDFYLRETVNGNSLFSEVASPRVLRSERSSWCASVSISKALGLAISKKRGYWLHLREYDCRASKRFSASNHRIDPCTRLDSLAKRIESDLIRSSGRGWRRFKNPGWSRLAVAYRSIKKFLCEVETIPGCNRFFVGTGAMRENLTRKRWRFSECTSAMRESLTRERWCEKCDAIVASRAPQLEEELSWRHMCGETVRKSDEPRSSPTSFSRNKARGCVLRREIENMFRFQLPYAPVLETDSSASNSSAENASAPEFVDVYITCVTSTDNVCFRFVEYEKDYEQLLEDMRLFYEGPAGLGAPSDVAEGDLYATCVEDVWLRVQTQGSPEDGQVECYFVDQGGTSRIPLQSLRVLDERFAEFPLQAIQCQLDGLVEYASCENAADILVELLLGKSLVAEVVRRVDPVLVVLFDTWGPEDLDLNMEIFLRLMAPHLPPGGQVAKAFLSHVRADGTLCLQMAGLGLGVLNSCMAAVNQYCKVCPDLVEKLSETKLYACRFSSDGRYYRAVVNSADPLPSGQFHVRYVDFGNEEAVFLSEFRDLDPLGDFVVRLPHQVVECRLKGLEEVTWNDELIARLVDLADGSTELLLRVGSSSCLV
ncbi:unnamed protein product [Ixodes hexagonus]